MERVALFAAFCMVVMALMGASGCNVGNPLGDADESYIEHLSRTLDGSGASGLDARTTNGWIAVGGSVLTQVTVQIVKEVRAYTEQEAEDFAQKVQVYAERNGDEIRVYTSYPKPPNHVQIEVTYEIQCPSGLDVNLNTTNGDIRVRNMAGDVDAVITNGAVDLQGGAGRVGLHTTNGNVLADVAALGGEGRFSCVNGSVEVEVRSGVAPVTATTVNGSVDVTLPADFSGQLDAQTSNGRVICGFPISVPAGNPQNSLAGPLGSGGSTKVVLRSTNGNVNLRRK